MSKIFFAYPSEPSQLSITLEATANSLRSAGLDAETWRELDLAGSFIDSGVMRAIDESDVVVADITRLNFNVTFEVGYAMASQKRLIPTLNTGLNPPARDITELGIFDTLGYEKYANSNDLAEIIAKVNETQAKWPEISEVNQHAPVYLLDVEHKNDASVRIASKIKKTKIFFRSFDPTETSRLSAADAYHQVSQSVAVVVHLLSPDATDHFRNNLRAAFLLGLAFGFGKEFLAFQDGNSPVPMDYRDLVKVYKLPSDIDHHIHELAPRVMEALQSREVDEKGNTKTTLLESLDLGSPAAENEISTLGSYYVATDEYNKTLAGGVRLVVGRKGAGKTALFLQVRDKIRKDRSKLVLDLRPEGYQLKRFKSLVLDTLTEAVKEHAAVAFWEFSLLLEIAYKLLEKDKNRYYKTSREQILRYENLSSLYERAGRTTEEGDFSERLRELTENIAQKFATVYGDAPKPLNLSANDITNLVYRFDISNIRSTLADYLSQKDEVWILFDNIDKGWPTHGVAIDDIMLLRAMLEASRKIEAFFAKKDLIVRTVLFVRNDVYELLVDESPDRGKEARVNLDWKDPDRLREVIRRRVVSNPGFSPGADFSLIWPKISVSHVAGIESSEFLIDRCLMRPRNLLTLLNYAKSNAVNLRHPKIIADDMLKAWASYSADIGNEIGLEIRDVSGTQDILYYFIGSQPILTLSQVQSVLHKTPIAPEEFDRIIELLLWFAFLGLQKAGDDQYGLFIYDVHYDMKKMRILAEHLQNNSIKLAIHKAFWPFLDIHDAVLVS